MVVISSSPKKAVTSTDFSNLFMENMHITKARVTHFLGVFIDEHFSWKQRMDIVSSNNYVNNANIVWASTSKSKLERLNLCQEHAAHVIYHKDWYAHASPLLNDMKALNVFKLNILFYV